MFKRPEELIMAILAAVWIVFTYFAASWFGAPGQTALLIAALNTVWTLVLFFLWLRGRHSLIWPLFLGLAAACWFPLLDWFAVSRLHIGGTPANDYPFETPWFASLPFKTVSAVLPVIAAYTFKFKQYRKRKRQSF
ncbi:MAG: hypothetical protein Q4A49_03660 [Neisseria sp.]|nr:hypothetical protein [Neisseria sp.]